MTSIWRIEFPAKWNYRGIVFVGSVIGLLGLHFIVVGLVFPQYPKGLFTLLPESDLPPDNKPASPALLIFIAVGLIVSGIFVVFANNRMANAQRSQPGLFGSRVYVIFKKLFGAAFAFVFIAAGLLMLLAVTGVIETVS